MESNNQQKASFRYTYSAKDQEEIRSIRQKYVPREEDKMERLRRLDRSVAVKARAWSVAVGILGVLVLGFGMSLFMTEFGAQLGIPANRTMPVGIGFGLVGGALVCLAYPLYQRVARHERKKIAPEIMRLTDELMK